ncbi:MAG: hypothetical protein KF900_10555 [Bacteroidetes bacterium]|nr:hypothetical protein [Bacteroidota bacterium]
MTNVIKTTAKTTVFAALLLMVNSCNKTKTVKIEGDAIPTADFTVGKSDYKGGETLVLTSSSSNVASLRWTLPDGTTAKSNSVSWLTDTAGHEQSFQFKLEAISENGTKSDYIVKNVKVNPTLGNMVLFGRTTSTVVPVSPATVTGTLSINGKMHSVISIPIISQQAAAPTNCFSQGYPVVSVPIGAHSLNFEYIIDHDNHVHIRELSTSATAIVKGCVFVYFTDHFE